MTPPRTIEKPFAGADAFDGSLAATANPPETGLYCIRRSKAMPGASWAREAVR